MRRNIIAITGVALTTLFVFALGYGPPRAEDGGATEVTGPTQVMETKEMMKIMMDPVWEDIRDLTEKAPEGRRDWRFLYIATFSLAEQHNLLFNRTDREYMATDDWRALSIEGLEASIALADSVREQDFDAILANKERTLQSCNACHERFEPGEAPEIRP